MKKLKKILFAAFTVAILSCLLCQPAFAAISESDVQAQVDAVGKEAVSGNVFIWFLCAIGFLKVGQKIDSFLSSLGVNVGHTGGSMLAEAMIAARGIGGIKNFSSHHFGGGRNSSSTNVNTNGGKGSGGFGAPYSLFKQASDTVRSGVIIGLGSRLQVFQSELIKKITAKNEIDLELPGQQPCAYFLVTSDQDSTFDFLASLFLSFCFIKLVRYADHNCEGGKLPVPVHILGEELTACGTIPDLSRRLSVIRSRNISMSCVFQNLAGLQNRYPQNLWQEIIGNCDAQLFLGCTDQLTAEFISARTGLASVAVSSKSKQLDTWRISNYTPEFRETSGVGKRPVLTPDEVLRLPLDQALIIIRGKKVLQVDKMDYSKHPEAKYLRSCKASAHVPEWRRLEEEAAKTPQPAPKPAPAAKKPAKRKATKPASPTDKSPKEAPAPKSAGTPEGIITTDKDSILS